MLICIFGQIKHSVNCLELMGLRTWSNLIFHFGGPDLKQRTRIWELLRLNLLRIPFPFLNTKSWHKFDTPITPVLLNIYLYYVLT